MEKEKRKSESEGDDHEERRASSSRGSGSGPSLFTRFVESFEGALKSVKEPSGRKLTTLDLNGVAEFIRAKKCHNVIVMTGAGISTNAGIPDFRSPGTGLYDNLAEYNLNNPMDVFTIAYFLQNPKPFYSVARKLLPKGIKPTTTHHFVNLLHKKGILKRWYTQNIDALEHATGIPVDKVIEAHGSYRTSTCMKCSKKYTQEWMEAKLADTSCEVPKCESCGHSVKPDIVFFGENLPSRFFKCAITDFPKCDLLIIIGTSLVVQPFAGMINEVGGNVPRLLINMEEAGKIGEREMAAGYDGLCYGHKQNTRDVFWKGPCDDGCTRLAELLDWELELENMVKTAEILGAGPHSKK